MNTGAHDESRGARALLAWRPKRTERRRVRPRGRRTAWRACLVAALLATGLLTVPAAVQAAPGDVGSEGPSYAGTTTPTGNKRAESVLWFNDGFWWGNLWDAVSDDFHIFRFDDTADQWVDTGVTTETRAHTHHDVLWDGTTLYVASNSFVSDGQRAVAGVPSTLRRYAYNTTTNTYTSLGSSRINNFRTETLTIDKDSDGRLWATWTQNDQIFLNNTDTDGATWGTPFALPGGAVSLDDTSALIAFGPNKMGVMWSRQGASAPGPTDGFYWSVHVDGASRTDWTEPVPVVMGARTSDDHMNLKWLDSSGGRVFAAVKTEFSSSTQPLIQLLAMDGTGAWTVHLIARVSECPNRVIVLIDEAAQRLRTFATYPKPSGTTNAGVCSSSGGAIYEKSSPLNNIAFTDKTPRIVDADRYVHNVSSTKQNLNSPRAGGASTANSGLMIIAAVSSTSRYWYHHESGGGTPPGDTTPPETTITAGPSGTVTATGASFEFSSNEAGSTFECQLDGAPFAACTSPQSYSGLAQGQHTFSVQARDAAGNRDPTPATRTWTIGTPPPGDTTPPETTITAGPSGTVTATGASFEFSSSEAGSTFECQLDGAPFAACTSPQSYSGLAQGQHTFAVQARDAAGNRDPTPATRTWTIGTTPSGGIVRSSFSTGVTTATTPLRIPRPDGVAAGDVLVGCVSLNGGSNPISTPAGWTPLASLTSLSNPKVYGYYKIATDTEPAEYTWGTSTVGAGVIARYTGASGLDTAVSSASGAAATSGAVPQVTTTTANSMLVGCMGVNSSSVTLSSPAGMSQAVETGDRRFELADGLQPAAGPSGSKTWTFSAAREWAGWLVALRSR